MYKLVALGGTGDVYLVCALYESFRQQRGFAETVVVTREPYGCIPEMFGVPYELNEALVRQAEANLGAHNDQDNWLLPNRYFYTHPCFRRSGQRVDQLTAKPDASQADMYRIILQLPADAPLALPKVPQVERRQGTILLIPHSVSWPNQDMEFWRKLESALRSASWNVEVNDARWSLRELFEHAASAEWVIGPQCGVMSIITTGQFPCRKTFAVASVDDNSAPHFLSRQTYPYAYVTKFANHDFDVEEYKITPDNHEEIITAIITGQNALQLWQHDPNPTMSISVPLTPGDFLDRLAVLRVKHERFPFVKRAAIDREYRRHVELKRLHTFPTEAEKLYEDLYLLHMQNYMTLERLVPLVIKGTDPVSEPVLIEEHLFAIRANRKRVEMKQKIDKLCHAPYQEVKSYYPPTKGEE